MTKNLEFETEIGQENRIFFSSINDGFDLPEEKSSRVRPLNLVQVKPPKKGPNDVYAKKISSPWNSLLPLQTIKIPHKI